MEVDDVALGEDANAAQVGLAHEQQALAVDVVREEEVAVVADAVAVVLLADLLDPLEHVHLAPRVHVVVLQVLFVNNNNNKMNITQTL